MEKDFASVTNSMRTEDVAKDFCVKSLLSEYAALCSGVKQLK